MSIKTSKKALKTLGVLTIIGSIFFFAAAVTVIFTANYIISTKPEGINTFDFQNVSTQIYLGAFSLIFRGIMNSLVGFYSIRAAKDNRYINTAWYFSIFALIISTVNFVRLFLNSSIPALTFLTSVINAVCCLILCVAAYTIKNYKEEEKIEESVPAEQ